MEQILRDPHNYHSILQLEHGKAFTKAGLKRQYYTLALTYHPDKCNVELAIEAFKGR